MTPSGYYEVLPDRPGDKYRCLFVNRMDSCGDGCCSWTEGTEIYLEVGSIIFVCDTSFGTQTYTMGSEYEGYDERNYEPIPHLDYVKEGYLKPTTLSNFEGTNDVT